MENSQGFPVYWHKMLIIFPKNKLKHSKKINEQRVSNWVKTQI